MGNAPPVGGGGDSNGILSHLVVIDKELIKSSVGEVAGGPVPGSSSGTTRNGDLFTENNTYLFQSNRIPRLTLLC